MRPVNQRSIWQHIVLHSGWYWCSRVPESLPLCHVSPLTARLFSSSCTYVAFNKARSKPLQRKVHTFLPRGRRIENSRPGLGNRGRLWLRTPRSGQGKFQKKTWIWKHHMLDVNVSKQLSLSFCPEQEVVPIMVCV